MFGARYSKIILRYPFFHCLFILLAPRPGSKWVACRSCLKNSFKNYLSVSPVYSSQSFYSPVSFLPGIILLVLPRKDLSVSFERSSVASFRLSRLFRELFWRFFRFFENCLFRNDSSENDLLFYRCRCSGLLCLRLVSCVQNNNNNNNKQVPLSSWARVKGLDRNTTIQCTGYTQCSSQFLYKGRHKNFCGWKVLRHCIT
mmetsp:Transcript_25973/g.54650  ORF Transcript_25973/g.54650 Transcript_25973/m.54650 type:complete len:200 (+) Transcript_25973:76-675(+)